MYRCTFGGRAYTGRNSQKTWWALRATIPRPSRCKQEVPAQICGFYGQTHKDLRNIGPFCFASVLGVVYTRTSKKGDPIWYIEPPVTQRWSR